MSIVAELVNGLVLRADLKERARRWEREDDEKGPEAEPFAVVTTRTFLPAGQGWIERRDPVGLSELPLPDGYIMAGPVVGGPVVGADEIRARHLVLAAQAEFGWGRSA